MIGFESKKRSAGAIEQRHHDGTEEDTMYASIVDFSTESARHEAVRRRDPRAEGRFYYSVATTGVYCRPTCAARPARPENVGFHQSPEAAERAGFRPCLRCRPREASQADRQALIVERARRLIESSEGPVTLAALARGAGLSPFHLHRLFRRQLGMTPRQYAAAHRLRKVGDELRDGSSVTAAIYQAGYSSSSRFYETDSGALGMTPSEVRERGRGVEVRAVVRECSLGQVLVAATTRGVCAVAFGDDAGSVIEELRQRFPSAAVVDSDPSLDDLASRVIEMVEATGPAPALPLDLIGTAFQQKVWRALRDIPRGKTMSYAELARQIGTPRAARAVGTACGRNPVAVAVPCHRVVRDDGALGGYRWGLERKRTLLERERRG
jgi:AraC family transcriptional regulator of adaptative response/methylated-DNA-[protein]-cysteine methyltransferase